ncbi:MAG TPA: FMN-binding protein [Candidatus Acidoferrum sp.]|nr:FMN-binding protein [Candidatus Acidoferrum sp.]
MKKFLLSCFVIGCFVVYSVHQRHEGAAVVVLPPAANKPQAPSSTNSTSTASSPTAQPNSPYKDGQYTGEATDAYYGYIQVQATIQNGKLTDVQFLQYPSDRSTSVYINSQAMPYLKQEAIQAQSANVDGVSGATDTSQAFIGSLRSALQKASNS